MLTAPGIIFFLIRSINSHGEVRNADDKDRGRRFLFPGQEGGSSE